MAKRRSKKMEVEVGSGNVFADLGFPDAAELDIAGLQVLVRDDAARAEVPPERSQPLRK
jgi:hypothetical protein